MLINILARYIVLIGISIFSNNLHAEGLYVYEREQLLPGVGSKSYDVLADGRLAVLTSTADLYVENLELTSNFEWVTSLPIADVPTFIAFSLNGLNVAVGGHNTVYICDLSSNTCSAFTASGFSGKWIDDRYILLSSSPLIDGEYVHTVNVLDTFSPNPSNPSNMTLIDNIGGVQADLTFDANQNLYVGTFISGVGGVIKFFGFNAWHNAFVNQVPVGFDSGVSVGTILTAGSLAIDKLGNLLVGGGSNLSEPNRVLLFPMQHIKHIIDNELPPFIAPFNGIEEYEDAQSCQINFTTIHVDTNGNRLFVNCFAGNSMRVYRLRLINVPLPLIMPLLLGIIFLCIVFKGFIRKS